jgi:hypothetical protein
VSKAAGPVIDGGLDTGQHDQEAHSLVGGGRRCAEQREAWAGKISRGTEENKGKSSRRPWKRVRGRPGAGKARRGYKLGKPGVWGP